jgi:predicted TIM-barrel fold metal-dependent hydrolase
VGRWEAPDLKRKPSEYFRTNCFLSVEAEEQTVKDYVAWFGHENLVFSTDYPHADSKFPRSVESFMTLPLSEAAKRDVLWGNWHRLYAL